MPTPMKAINVKIHAMSPYAEVTKLNKTLMEFIF